MQSAARVSGVAAGTADTQTWRPCHREAGREQGRQTYKAAEHKTITPVRVI